MYRFSNFRKRCSGITEKVLTLLRNPEGAVGDLSHIPILKFQEIADTRGGSILDPLGEERAAATSSVSSLLPSTQRSTQHRSNCPLVRQVTTLPRARCNFCLPW